MGENDEIKELFQLTFENHEVLIDDSDWEKIEKRIYKGKNKTHIWLYGIITSAAAVIAALFVVNSPLLNNKTDFFVSQQIKNDETSFTNPKEQIIDKEVQKQGTGYTVNGAGYKQIIDIEVQKPDYFSEDSVNQSFNNSINQSLNNSVNQSIDNSVNQSFDNSVNQSFNNSMIVQTPENEEDTLIADFHENEISKQYIYLANDLFYHEKSTSQNTEKWILAANFKISGYSDVLNNANNDLVFEKSDGNNYAHERSHSISSLTNMSKDDFTKIRHLPPLSFGLTVSKNRGQKVIVESGLVYTFLSSQLEWEGFNVNQSLHYLGIPLNLTVNLWRFNQDWNIYSSAGIIVDKGLQGIYRQENIIEKRITTVYRSVSGVQWSLNGAIGVNYRLGKVWGIYFEPRIGYSFNCKQPLSSRTEYPLYFGINIGFNFEL